MKIFLLVLVVIVVCFIFMKKQGNLAFWSLVSKKPKEAYHLFDESPEWVIALPGTPDSLAYKKSLSWIGPFLILAPQLGGITVEVFCKEEALDAEQRRIGDLLRQA